MTSNLWIRPVHCKHSDELLSIVVCTTKDESVISEQIIRHFPYNASGKDIRTNYPDDAMLWGPPILADVLMQLTFGGPQSW